MNLRASTRYEQKTTREKNPRSVVDCLQIVDGWLVPGYTGCDARRHVTRPQETGPERGE